MTLISEVATTSTVEIYTVPEARRILEHLLTNPGTSFTPSILPTDEVSYPAVESILEHKTSRDKSIQLLKTMADKKALVAELVDKVPSCPVCASTQVSTRYLCPQCFTYDISQTFLFEHLKCGKVGSDDAFRKDEKIVCPKCQTVLHEFGVEYRAVGAWYKCNRCAHSFNSPVHSHFCRPSHHEFSPDGVQLRSLFEYRINPDTLDEIKRKVLVYAEAITQLESLGLTILAPHNLPGKSGQSHPFDVVIRQEKKGWRGGEKTIVLDIIVGQAPVGTEAVKKFHGKVRDVKPAEGWLISVPGLDAEAETLIRNFSLSHAEGTTLREAVQVFQNKSDVKSYVER